MLDTLIWLLSWLLFFVALFLGLSLEGLSALERHTCNSVIQQEQQPTKLQVIETMVEWPKITAKIIFNLKTFAPTNCGEKCLLKLFPPKETRLPKMLYRSLKSSTSLKCYLSIRPTAPPSHPNGRPCESLSPLTSDWGGGVGG